MEGIDNVVMRNDNENVGKLDTVVFIHTTGLTILGPVYCSTTHSTISLIDLSVSPRYP